MGHRGGQTAGERARLSRLRQLLSRPGLLRGNLVRMARTCGNPGCRCTRGQRHVSWYLAQSQEGTRRMLYVPEAWLGRAREWTQRYAEIRRLLWGLSDLYWERLKRRRD